MGNNQWLIIAIVIIIIIVIVWYAYNNGMLSGLGFGKKEGSWVLRPYGKM